MRRNKKRKIYTLGAHVSTIISVSLVLLIVGFVIVAFSFTNGMSDSLRRDVAVVVNMKYGVEQQQIDSVAQYLDRAPYVSSYNFISADDVYAQEHEYNSTMLELLDENPYSPEFDVFLEPRYANGDSINSLVQTLTSIDCVDEVYSAVNVIDNISRFLHRATFVMLILGAIMLLISIALIINSINLSIYSRRFIIHTMKMVGAKASFIRRPFVLSGIKMGCWAALIASAVICCIHAYATTVNADTLFFGDWVHTAAVCIILLITGILLCGLSAYFVTSRFLRYSIDSLYK